MEESSPSSVDDRGNDELAVGSILTIIAKGQKRQKQQQQHFENCTVCAKENGGHYKYYNVYCCESCKQFFRRIVVNQKEFHCFRGGKCRTNQLLHCQGCRLDRCLRKGMEPSMVKTDKRGNLRLNQQFVEQLEQRKRHLLEEEQQPTIHSSVIVEHAAPTNQAAPDMAYGDIWHIWRSCTELSMSCVFRHEELRAYLRDQNYLLANLECFSSEPPSHCPEQLEYFLRANMLALEVTKLLPFFKQLELDDQQKLLHKSIRQMPLLLEVFYSMESGAETLTKNDVFISALAELRRFGVDSKLRNMGELVNVAPVQKCKLASIERDEFGLLVALMLTNADADYLSPKARDFLYAESVRLAGILLRLLQYKYGHFTGSARFTAAIDLLSMPVNVNHDRDQQLLSIYLALFHQQQTATTEHPRESKFTRQSWEGDF